MLKLEGTEGLSVLALAAAAALATACGSQVFISPEGSGGAGGGDTASNSSNASGTSSGGSGSSSGGSGGSGGASTGSSGSSSGGSGGMGPGPCYGAVERAVSFGGGGLDFVEALLQDPSGRLYIAGRTVGAVSFSNSPVVYPAFGGTDVFLARLEPDLQVSEVVLAGNGQEQRINDMAFAPDGHLVIVGESEGSFDIGGISIPSAGLGSDIFVAKLTVSGQLLWSAVLSGPGMDVGNGVTVDAQGRITIVGSFEEQLNVGATQLVSAGNADVLVAQFDANGTSLWAQSFGDIDFQVANKVEAFSDGSVGFIGTTRGQVDFGGGPSGPQPGNIIWHAFVAKLDENGGHLWSGALSSTQTVRGRTLALDTTGALVTAGQFSGTADLMGMPVSSAGQTDIFMLKIGPDGTPQWAQGWGDGAIQNLREVSTTASDQILFSLPASGGVDFGCGPLGGMAGSPLAVFLKLNPDGSTAFATAYGDPPGTTIPHQYGVHAIELPSGDLAVLGAFSGSIQLGDEVLTSNGELDGFVAILSGVP